MGKEKLGVECYVCLIYFEEKFRSREEVFFFKIVIFEF